VTALAAVIRRKYRLEYLLVMGVERMTRRGNHRVALRIRVDDR
jgi:hypothetical protein